MIRREIARAVLWGWVIITHLACGSEPESSEGDSMTQPMATTGEGVACAALADFAHRDRLGVLTVYLDPGIDHERAAQVLDAARDVGAGWIRMGMLWALANPAAGQHDFAEYDWLVDQARARGLSILPTVTWTPRWASANRWSLQYFYYPPTEELVEGLSGYAHLEAFARTVAARYAEAIDRWELWNEPDMAGYFKDADGDSSTAADYAKMLSFFARGVRAGNPQARVVLGGLAQGPAEYGCEPGYLAKILADPAHPAGAHFDLHNIHTNFQTPAEIRAQIEENRGVLAAFGLDKPLVITETSYTSSRWHQSLPEYRGGQAGLARYVTDALTAQLDEGAEIVFWAAFHDYKPLERAGAYQRSGLYTYELEAKQAAQVFTEVSCGAL